MAEKRPQDPIYVTPKGVAKYAHLNVPQTKFKPEGEYSINLLLDPNDALTIELVEKITEDHEKGLAAAQATNKKLKLNDMGLANCFKADVTKEGEPTGRTSFKFKATASGIRKADKSTWSWKPTLMNGAGQGLSKDAVIFGGSVVQVAYTIRHTAMATGAFYTKLQLKAVQAHILKEAYEKSAADFGFSVTPEDQDAFGEQVAGEQASDEPTDF